MSTTTRYERTPVTTPAISPAHQGRNAARSDADRITIPKTATSHVTALVTGAFLLGGLLGFLVPAVSSGDITPTAPAPIQEVDRGGQELAKQDAASSSRYDRSKALADAGVRTYGGWQAPDTPSRSGLQRAV